MCGVMVRGTHGTPGAGTRTAYVRRTYRACTLVPCSSPWEYPGSKLPCAGTYGMQEAGTRIARTYTLRKPCGGPAVGRTCRHSILLIRAARGDPLQQVRARVRVRVRARARARVRVRVRVRVRISGLESGLGLGLGLGLRLEAEQLYHFSAGEPVQATLGIWLYLCAILVVIVAPVLPPEVAITVYHFTRTVRVGVGHTPICDRRVMMMMMMMMMMMIVNSK